MEDLWAPPVHCRGCGQPMAQGLEACPSCARPTRFSARRVLGALGTVLFYLAGLGAGALVLLLLLPFSPVLSLFPLLFIGTGPKPRRRGTGAP